MEQVTVGIPTLGRYSTTFPMALMSVICQTVTPRHIHIYDDNEKHLTPLHEYEPYNHLFKMMELKGIGYDVWQSQKRGLVSHRRHLLANAQTEFVWIFDDDQYAEATVLETLLNTINSDPKIGAVGSLIPQPLINFNPRVKHSSKLIDNSIFKVNSQWVRDGRTEPYEVDHLYSGFLYRKEAGKHGYPELSKVSHREDTLFSYGMVRNGWKLVVNPSVTTWHLRSGGGIREFRDNPELWAADDAVFQKVLDEDGIKIPPVKVLVISGGIGDHYMLKAIIPEVLEKYKGWRVIVAAARPELFTDSLVEVVDYTSAKYMLELSDKDLDYYNAYFQGKKKNHKGPMIDLYRKMYLKSDLGELIEGVPYYRRKKDV